jgi:hypothetical protein
MRVIRAFAAGIGVGYLIWSGAGRRLLEKVQDMQQGREPALRAPAAPGATTTPTGPDPMASSTMGGLTDEVPVRSGF